MNPAPQPRVEPPTEASADPFDDQSGPSPVSRWQMSRRALLGTGAAGTLAAGLLAGGQQSAVAAPRDEDGYQLWLRYRRVPDRALLARYRAAIDHVVVHGDSAVLQSAAAELSRGLSGLLGRTVPIRRRAGRGAVVVGVDLVGSAGAASRSSLRRLGEEGFAIRRLPDRERLVISSTGERGVLYGAFALLRHLQRHRSIERLRLTEQPAAPIRMFDHWDNLDRTIERGFAGKSIFHWDDLPDLDPRYTDYARVLASVGINQLVINNVNAQVGFLSTERLPGLAALAGVLRDWGIRMWISADFASPITMTADDDDPIETADPFDKRVQAWWRDKIAEIYSRISDFGGFLVKANSEGKSGPLDYGRTHADGANMIAERLARHGGRILWRSFVHEGFSDWAEYEYNAFHPLDGDFSDHAIVQTKNGPVDFQVREPVNPLFGGLPHTNQLIELQITQEYTGQSTHLCYLVPEWKIVLDFPTHTGDGAGPTVADIVTGAAYEQSNVGFAGVANIGDDRDWTGYQLGAANTHGFARLAWDPDLSAEDIVHEWIDLTFGVDRRIRSVLTPIMLQSWRTYEQYTSPLGIGYLTYPLGAHFAPDPSSTHNLSHYTTEEGTGFDRSSATGTGYPALYDEHWAKIYESTDTCPDDLLLFMHWVRYTHRLHSGKSVIQHIYDAHFDGVESVRGFRRDWQRLRGRVDHDRHTDIAATFDRHLAEAIRWRDTMVSYFFSYSKIISTGRGWLQAAYPEGRLLFGGVQNQLAVDLTNATRTGRRVPAAVRPVDADWTSERRTATVGSAATAHLRLPVTPPAIADQVSLDLDLPTELTALGGSDQLFVVTPAAQLCHLALDAGSADSPLVPGYQRLTPESAWDETLGYGWTDGTPQSRDRGGAWDALRRDFCTDYPAHTLRISIPAGRQRVSVLVGDGGPDVPPTMITEDGELLVASEEMPGGNFTWVHVDLDGGASGRTADLTFDSEPDRVWHLGALVIIKN